ncbi:hypothetical protein N7488_012326 [Penicillium malachiteum]|nr:hypothetical protein N7488_012326 [Penicillium malachiteum]
MVSCLIRRSSLLLLVIDYILQAAATSVPIVSCSIDQPQLFTNPSFEDGTTDGWTITDSSANAVVVDVDSSSSSFTTAADGQYYVDMHSSALRGGDALFLRQTLDGLDTSMTYTISFSMAAASFSSSTAQYCYIYVFKDAQANADLLEEFEVKITSSGQAWTEYSLSFQPTSESHLILFLPECTGTTHVGFDNFQFLQPETTLCSTSYSTVPTASSTFSSSIASSQLAIPTSTASVESVFSSIALSHSPSPVHSSSALVSATGVSHTAIVSSSKPSASSKSPSSSSTPTQISSRSVASSSALAPVPTSHYSVVVSVSQTRSALHSTSARALSPPISASVQSSHLSSALRLSSVFAPGTTAAVSKSTAISASRQPCSLESLSSFHTVSTVSTSSSILPSDSPSPSSTLKSSSVVPAITLSSFTINPSPETKSDPSAISSESTASGSTTQPDVTSTSQGTHASEPGYTIIPTPTSTGSSGNRGGTVTGTSYSTSLAKVGNTQIGGWAPSVSEQVSSSTMIVTKTSTVTWPNGKTVTETTYQTVVECPEATQTSSPGDSAPSGINTENVGSETISATLSGSAALASESSGTSSSSISSEESSPVSPNEMQQSGSSTFVSVTLSSSNSIRTAAHNPGFSHGSSAYAIGSSQSNQPVATSNVALSTNTSMSAVYTGLATRVANGSTLAIVIIAVLMLADLL